MLSIIKPLFLLLVMIISLVIYFKLISQSENIQISRFDQNINIVLWTKWFSNEWPTYKPTECEYNNCVFTRNREEVQTSDAILFHWRDIDERDVPNVKPFQQKWVLFNMESPINTYTSYSTHRQTNSHLFKSFDWIMSYRTDSDIYVPYGSIQRCRKD